MLEQLDTIGIVLKEGELNTLGLTKATRDFLQNEHYNRNQYNVMEGGPTNLSDAMRLTEGEVPLLIRLSEDKSLYHVQGYDEISGIVDNPKFVSTNGGNFEFVFDKHSGNLVTDVVNQGTYNFYGPDNVVGHSLFDVAPYWVWGNSYDDPTNFHERILGTYDGPIPRE